MIRFKKTSEGKLELTTHLPCSQLTAVFLTKKRSQTTSERENMLLIEEIRRYTLLVEPIVDIQNLIFPARKNSSITLQVNEN